MAPDPDGPRGAGRAESPPRSAWVEEAGGSAAGLSAAGVEELEVWLAAVLEAEPGASAEMLARLELEDRERARRARSRLVALGELGMAVDTAPRSIDPPAHFGPMRGLERGGGGGMGECSATADRRSSPFPRSNGAQTAPRIARRSRRREQCVEKQP